MRERMVHLQRYGMGDELLTTAYRAAVTLAQAAKESSDDAGHRRWLEVAERMNPNAGEAPAERDAEGEFGV